MTRTREPHRPASSRARRRWTLMPGVGALVLLAVVATACGSSNGSTGATPTTTGGSSSVSTTGGSGSSSASSAVKIDPCSVVTDAVAVKAYGPGATVTTSPSSDNRTCQVSVQGLSYDLSIHVDPASDYKLQKSIVFVNPTDFPGLGKEAVIGKGSDSQGAQLGLLYRTDGGIVYISGESDLAKLKALAGAIAAQG